MFTHISDVFNNFISFFLMNRLLISLIIISFLCADIPVLAGISPKALQKIKADIEKQIPTLKVSLIKEGLNKDHIDFSLDTFRIEHITDKRLELDNSTNGVKETLHDMIFDYDKLMNKYFNKLLKLLSEDDKISLTTAQKAWIAHRDTEEQLINTLSKQQYSGGGAEQSIISLSLYADLIENRAITIFDYFNDIVQDE